MEKKGDETVDSMLDEIFETHVASDGTLEANLKPDPAQEMEAAVADMTRSFKEFREAADSPIAAHGYQWWKALMYLSFAEDRLKTAFLGRDRSPKSIAQYHRWRMSVIFCRRIRVDS